MSETLTIHVENPKLGIDDEVSVSLPVIIGREGKIELDPDDLRYSRQHAILSNFGDGLVLEDRSQNGTRVEREHRIIKGEHVPLVPSDRFSIFDYTFTVGGLAQQPVQHVNTSCLVCWRNAPREEVDHVHVSPGYQAEIHIYDQYVDLQPGNAGSSNPGVSLAFSNGDSGLTMHVLHQLEGYEIYRNNRLLAERTTPVALLDVITAAGHRLEIVSQDYEVLICGNEACQLLNVHEPEAQCRFCGRDLVHGGTLFGTSLLRRR